MWKDKKHVHVHGFNQSLWIRFFLKEKKSTVFCRTCTNINKDVLSKMTTSKEICGLVSGLGIFFSDTHVYVAGPNNS